MKPQKYTVDEKGSLGLLALGDVGLRAWRKARKQANTDKKNESKSKKK